MKICTKCLKEKEISLFAKDIHCKDGIRSLCKECYNDYHRKHSKTENGRLARRRAGSKWSAKKRKEDPGFRLILQIRNRMKNALKTNAKSGSAIRDLGCSVPEYIKYLESKFLPGMSWENHGRGQGKWQIDHIVPLSKVDLTDRERFLKACHYSNTQPLWSIDNFIKGNK